MMAQWVHLAAVYDPASRSITQYVNGTVACHEEIKDEFVIHALQIGAAEIGNWDSLSENHLILLSVTLTALLTK